MQCRVPFWIVFALLGSSVSSAQQRQPFIINGLPTADFPAVGIVGEASVGGFCTGTLIAPNHVLTAAHCGEAILDLGTDSSGTFEIDGRIYRTTRVEIHPDYNNRIFTNDVAILVLEESVTGVEPMELSSRAPEVGELVTIVGFGGQGTPELGSDGSFGQKLVGMVAVDNVTDTEFSWLFDDLTESNPAPGDSGGPVLVDDNGELLIAGIVSSGTAVDAELGDTSYSMLVPAYSDWIAETVLATVGGEPVEEPPSEPEPSTDPGPPTDPDPPADPEPPAGPESPAEPETPDEPEAVDSPAEEPTTDSDEVTDPVQCSSGHPGRHRGHHRGHGYRNCAASDRPGCDTEESASTEESGAVEVEATDRGRRRTGQRRPSYPFRQKSRGRRARPQSSRINVRR